jgi:hypothetical protein
VKKSMNSHFSFFDDGQSKDKCLHRMIPHVEVRFFKDLLCGVSS